MEKYTVSYQQRTAVGDDQSEKTVVHVYHFTPDDELRMTAIPENLPPAWACEIVAEVTIIHPWLMAGTQEEICSEFYYLTEKELRKNDRIEENDWGTQFWKASI